MVQVKLHGGDAEYCLELFLDESILLLGDTGPEEGENLTTELDPQQFVWLFKLLSDCYERKFEPAGL
jgi:hypothetical protein